MARTRKPAPPEALPMRSTIRFHIANAEKYLKGRQTVRADWHLAMAKEASLELATLMEQVHPLAEVVAS